MVITSNPLVTTIETLRDRVRHLEAETAALRSDLDLMLVWATWESNLKHRVRREEEEAAIMAVVEAAVHIAAESGFELPVEMEAVIGD